MKRGALLVFGGALAAIGCHDRGARALGENQTFIALERDFQGFEAWHQVKVSDRPAIGQAHAAGDAHEYINHLPEAGSNTFPVGTILVKTVRKTGDGKKPLDVFAMVKRGGGYNAQGSPGWEWFELRPRADASLGIVWRGINPPDGEGYGRDVKDGCNGCHQKAAHNDYVQAPALSLSKI